MQIPVDEIAALLPYDFRPAAEMAHRRSMAMVAKLRADPALLAIPLANIDRWLARGHNAVARLEGWRTMIEAAQRDPAELERMLALLVDDSDEAMQWQEFFPSPGILTAEELKQFSWNSAH